MFASVWGSPLFMMWYLAFKGYNGAGRERRSARLPGRMPCNWLLRGIRKVSTKYEWVVGKGVSVGGSG